MPHYNPETDDTRPLVLELWGNLLSSLKDLDQLMLEVNGHWTYEDGIYRMYHQSFKVWNLQPVTTKIVDHLQALMPSRKLNAYFRTIVKAGTGKKFYLACNRQWLKHSRPIVEAFLHAKYFLEMLVKYAREFQAPPKMLPSGWAAVLYLYNLR